MTVTRIGYRAPGVPIVYPADEQLSLPAETYSAGLQELIATGVAGGSFQDAVAAAFRATGMRIGRRQAGQLARRAAADFGSFYAGRRAAGAGGPGDVLVLEADGKGIKMLPGSLRPETARNAARAAPKQDGRLSRGEVRTRKRMAEAGAVFRITPVPRTADDIMPVPGAVPGTPAAPAPQPPDVQDKWLTASVADNAARVVAAIFAEADRRDPGRERTWIALVDGNKDQITRIEVEAAARGIEVPVLIDII